MKSKKVLSTVVASALVATTMAVPAMAAEGGSIDVPVTTKTAVLRVEVPTKMNISVNQFEMGDDGSQIYSSDFDMKNKSEIPVKVDVTSTADLKTSTKLVATKSAAETSSEEGEVWMAVAAKTGASSFADGTATAIKDLTEGNKNVTTFEQGKDAAAAKGTAGQTFYLNKSDAMAYKLLNANEDASGIEYAQFYELTAKTVANDAALVALLADNDIYVATAAAADGQALTKVAKGGTHTYASSEVYYTASLESTAKASIDAAKLYVYGNGNVDTDGAAAFRYIGRLSGAQETWTKDDITQVSIKYDIVGVQESKYTEIKDECTYGLYPAVTGPQVSVSADGVVSIANLDGALFASMTVNDGSGDYTIPNDNKEGTWEWDDDDAATLKTFTFNSSWSGSTVTVTITLTDGTKITSGSVTLS